MYSAFARNWPFWPATVPLPWSKASKIQGEGPRWSWEWKSHKNFVCTRNAAVDKNAPSMGALRGAPLSLGPSAQNLGSKSAFPRPWWALDTEEPTARWGVMFIGWPCCCRDATWPILALTDAPCCELSRQKIKSWVWVNTGIILEQIPVVRKWNAGIVCEGVPARHGSR